MADFTQITKALTDLSSSDTKVSVKITPKGDDLKEFVDDLQGVIHVLRNGLDELAAGALKGVQKKVVARAESAVVGFMHTVGGAIWQQREQGAKFDQVIGVLRKPPVRIGDAKAGIASYKELQEIRLDPVRILQGGRSGEEVGKDTGIGLGKKRSEYDRIWQIVEFGTGTYAEPNVRTSGDSKIPGGGGAWRFGNTSIAGQPGVHFLFPYRHNLQASREDMAAAVRVVDRAISEILSRGGRASLDSFASE